MVQKRGMFEQEVDKEVKVIKSKSDEFSFTSLQFFVADVVQFGLVR